MFEMPLYVYGCVGAVLLSVPVLWWSVASADPGIMTKLVRENLGAPAPPSTTDVREVELSQSARERIVDPFLGVFTGLGRRFLPASVASTLLISPAAIFSLNSLQPRFKISFCCIN